MDLGSAEEGKSVLNQLKNPIDDPYMTKENLYRALE
jgi:hypothetical protein